MKNPDTAADDGAPIHNNHWVTIFVIAAIYTAAFLDRHSMALLADPIRQHLGVTDFQVSLLLGLAFSTFYALMNVPAGVLIDRIDRRKLIFVTGACWSVASIACGLSNTYWQLLVSRMVLGGAEAFIAPAAFALMRDRVPADLQGRSYSILGMCPFVGGTLALILGGALLRSAMAGSFDGVPLLAALEPWQIVLVVLGVFAFFPILLLVFIAPDGMRHQTGGSGIGFAEAIAHLKRHKGAYAILVGYASISSMLTFGKGAWAPTMMSRTYEIPLPEIGLVSGPISLVSAVSGLILCGFIIDAIGKRGGNVTGFAALTGALASIAALGIPLMPEEWMAWTCFGMSSFFSGAFYPIGARTLARITPSPIMGKVSALYLLSQNLIGSALGPMAIAFMSDNWFEGRLALGHAMATYSGVVGVAIVLLAFQLDRCDKL